MFRVTACHKAIGNHVLLYSLQPLWSLDYVKILFNRNSVWDSAGCKMPSPHSFINKIGIKRPKKVELEDGKTMWSKVRIKFLGFTKVNVKNLSSPMHDLKTSFYSLVLSVCISILFIIPVFNLLTVLPVLWDLSYIKELNLCFLAEIYGV